MSKRVEEILDFTGICPKCGGYISELLHLNIMNDCSFKMERHHYIACHACRTKWLVGLNFLNHGNHEIEDENKALLQAYEEVTPLFSRERWSN